YSEAKYCGNSANLRAGRHEATLARAVSGQPDSVGVSLFSPVQALKDPSGSCARGGEACRNNETPGRARGSGCRLPARRRKRSTTCIKGMTRDARNEAPVTSEAHWQQTQGCNTSRALHHIACARALR